MADPDAFYSAVVQSSAGVVAIVGGFIASTLINRSADRDSVRARIEEREAEVATLERQQSDARRAKARYISRTALDDAVTDIVKVTPLPDAGSLQVQLDMQEVDTEIFSEEWDALRARIEREWSRLQSDFEHHPPMAYRFSAWVEAGNVDMTGRDEDLVEYLYAEEVRRGFNRDPDFFRTSHYDFQLNIPSAYDAAVEQRILAGLESEIASAGGQMARANAQLSVLRERLVELGAPPHFWGSMAALLLLTVVGIFYPLVLMPQEADDFTAWHKWSVIVAFLIGIGGVLASVVRLVGAPKVSLSRLTRWRQTRGDR